MLRKVAKWHKELENNNVDDVIVVFAERLPVRQIAHALMFIEAWTTFMPK